MDLDLRENDDITINRISINGMNLKELLNDELVKKLDEKIGNYTLFILNILLDGEMPSSLISAGYNLGGDYKKISSQSMLKMNNYRWPTKNFIQKTC